MTAAGASSPDFSTTSGVGLAAESLTNKTPSRPLCSPRSLRRLPISVVPVELSLNVFATHAGTRLGDGRHLWRGISHSFGSLGLQRGSALLDDVAELVSEQPLARGRIRRVFAGAEEHV